MRDIFGNFQTFFITKNVNSNLFEESQKKIFCLEVSSTRFLSSRSLFKAIITWRFITKKLDEISKNGKNYCWQKLPTKITTQCSLIMNDPHKKGPGPPSPKTSIVSLHWVCQNHYTTSGQRRKQDNMKKHPQKPTHTVPKVPFCPKSQLSKYLIFYQFFKVKILKDF